jgi:hypothetical protein
VRSVVPILAWCASACTFQVEATPGTGDGAACAWAASRELVFANQTRPETLVSFPVLVVLEDGVNVDYALAAPGGRDLRFLDADGHPLAYEIERWNPPKPSYVWVGVPTIAASSSTDHIWMDYGNSAAAPAQDRTGVWAHGYVAVWHLGEDPTAGSVMDSSPGPNDAQATPLARAPTSVDGRVAAGIALDGVDDRLAVTSDVSLNVIDMTLEAWVRVTAPAQLGWHTIFEHDRGGPSWYGLWTSGDSPGHFHFRWSGGGDPRMDFTVPFVAGGWHHVAGTLDATTRVARTYQDGFPDRTDTNPTAPAMTTVKPLTIGENTADSEPLRGDVDEVRISNVARSAAWIDAQHASMTNSFVTFGAPEPPAVCPP